jgi:phosphoribosylamine--glycine ligase
VRGSSTLLSARGHPRRSVPADEAAAQLEGSKAFLKHFAARHGIPTAPFDVVTRFEDAERVIRARGAPIVVKADGLCAGKGVVVASSVDEALDAARAMLVDGLFGDAGRTVVLEACLVGVEVSLLALSDGERLVVMPPARDHKRAYDGDKGPNTGGMGVIAPISDLDAETLARIEREILRPTIAGMAAEGAPFRGVLFAGLMLTADGPMLLEHNVRFGDPECEALMELWEGDVVAALHGAATGALDPSAVRFSSRHACVVVVAAAGYPTAPRAGDAITGLEAAEALADVSVLHAGTALRDGALVTAGGRVLAVTGVGDSARDARERAYAAVAHIKIDGAFHRRDIGLSNPPAEG